MSMKRILLTGANGFVGNYFLKKYSSSYEIITFSFLNDNFANLDLSNIDVVIHCSALVHQMQEASWELYEKINIHQTIQLADKAKKSGVKHFIFLSTIKVYGEESNKCYYENSRTNPTDYYSVSKLKAEDSIRNIESPNFKILSSMHFYGWRKGLKTGMYYLRTRPSSKAMQFTIEPEKPCETCSA